MERMEDFAAGRASAIEEVLAELGCPFTDRFRAEESALYDYWPLELQGIVSPGIKKALEDGDVAKAKRLVALTKKILEASGVPDPGGELSMTLYHSSWRGYHSRLAEIAEAEGDSDAALAHSRRAEELEAKRRAVIEIPNLNLRYLIQYQPCLRRALADALAGGTEKYVERRDAALAE